MDVEFQNIRKAGLLIDSLCIFTNLRNDSVIKEYKKLLKYLMNDKLDICEAVRTYNDFVHELLKKSKGASLRKYVIDKILLDDNVFTEIIDKDEAVSDIILKQIKFELKALEFITSVKSSELRNVIIYKCKAINFEEDIVNSLMDYEEVIENNSDTYKTIDRLKTKILDSNDFENSLDDIINFYKKYGTGIFGQYKVFVWEYDNNIETLKGIENPDPVKLSDLIGYDEQKKVIVENTEQFLKGYPANNILLYGQRGTGKSSTVKAIVNEYYSEGLRLIEVEKDKLKDFTKIIRKIRDKNLKFIIFVDDLVFEDGDESYSALKTILEGNVENKESNMLIYATTNRKHLVRETFSERGDEVHKMDSIEEKLSLADRFGITVSFYSPDQKEYLNIVSKIAAKRNLDIDEEYLKKEAVKWTQWYNGKSPRTAKQFVDYIEGTKA